MYRANGSGILAIIAEAALRAELFDPVSREIDGCELLNQSPPFFVPFSSWFVQCPPVAPVRGGAARGHSALHRNHHKRSANSFRVEIIFFTISSFGPSHCSHTRGLPPAPGTSFVNCQRTLSPTQNLYPQSAHRNFSPGAPRPHFWRQSSFVATHGLPFVKLTSRAPSSARRSWRLLARKQVQLDLSDHSHDAD